MTSDEEEDEAEDGQDLQDGHGGRFSQTKKDRWAITLLLIDIYAHTTITYSTQRDRDIMCERNREVDIENVDRLSLVNSS